MSALGQALALYFKSGGVAFLVDNAEDLHRACFTIDSQIRKSAVAPVVMPMQMKCYWEGDMNEARSMEEVAQLFNAGGMLQMEFESDHFLS